jgi:hypothetical protein
VNDLPLVRLSRDGRRAVCANVDCGEPFAERLELVREPMRAVLAFLPGWHEFSGEMLMSTRARKRISQGLSPAFRRTPGATRNRRSPGSNRVVFGEEAPMTVVCPACGLRQEVNEQALGLR